MKKDGFWSGLLAGVLLTLAVTAAILFATNSYLIPSFFSQEEGLTKEEKSELLKKFSALKMALDQNFLDGIDEETHRGMLDAAYKAYVDAMGDKYSKYFTEQEYDDYIESMSGSYSGIGVTVQMDEEKRLPRITAISKGGACYGTEIRVGDFICGVDGRDVAGLDLDGVVSLIRGIEGTDVSVTFLSGETDEKYEMKLTRKAIETETVAWRMMDGKTAYIAITEFDAVTASQFAAAIRDAYREGAEGYILDVRDNPGGYLDIVVAMADMLVPEGIVTYTVDKDGNREEYRSDADMLGLPLVVLCNGNSASASELFCGALKDYGVATLVGTTTFGKGIVQTSFRLYDRSALKTTIARYYTPSGVCIHQVGITPDVEVELEEGVTFSPDLPYEQDAQLQKAYEIMQKKLAGEEP